jgi:hypothetical protein
MTTLIACTKQETTPSYDRSSTQGNASTHRISPRASGINVYIGGVWTVTSQGNTGCSTPRLNVTTSFSCPVINCGYCQTFNFNSDSTFTSTTIHCYKSSTPVSDSYVGKYKVIGHNVTLSVSGAAAEVYTAVMFEETLTLTSREDLSSGCIKTIVLTR